MSKNSNPIMKQWQDEIALARFEMIAPLTEDFARSCKARSALQEIAETNGLSYKTIKRYDEAYQTDGFEVLKPKSRMLRNQDSLPENFEELLQRDRLLVKRQTFEMSSSRTI